MRTTQTFFIADGLKLAAMWLEPDGANNGLAPVVICSGFTGLMTIHPSRFARALTAQGWRCFVFDYRGFGESEGERGRTVLEEWVRDMRAACAFAAHDARAEQDRVALAAWGMGGGVAVAAAVEAPELIGVAAINSFYDGPRFLRHHLDDAEFARYRERAAGARAEAARTGKWPEADADAIYPLDPDSADYVEDHLNPYKGYDWTKYQLCLADSLLTWRPEDVAHRSALPLFLAHGVKNGLHAPLEADALQRAYAGPLTRWDIPGGHTEWMHDDHPLFRDLARELERWLRTLPVHPESS